jgi:SNF2 family DNA or RNA helicase
MTGTEFGNSVLDLYGPWEYRQKYFWLIPSFDKFKKRYENTMPVLDHDGNFSHEVHVGWQRIDEIHDKINPYTIRAKREDWLPTVEETHEPVFFKLHPAERKAYDELKKQMFTILENGEEITITQRNQFYMRARTITGGWATLEERISPVPSKAEILYDLLFDENSQCIVWCIFRHEVEYLTKFLNDKEIPTVGYSGDTTNTEKTPTIQKFQNGEARVIVANEAMSKGFSLQMCNNHIFYTLPNKSLNFYQQKDRSAGIGAKDQIFYRYLMAMDTVDTKIKSMLDENQDLLYSFQTGTLKQIVDLL